MCRSKRKILNLREVIETIKTEREVKVNKQEKLINQITYTR